MHTRTQSPACVHTHTHTYVFAFPGSAARTIALFEKHFCPEQSMNLSFNCRNNGDLKSLTEERPIPQGRRIGRYRISKRSTTGYYINQSILRYYGRSITFKNLVSPAVRCLTISPEFVPRQFALIHGSASSPAVIKLVLIRRSNSYVR